jgi:hypothetical protein
MANELMERGLRSLYGEVLGKHITDEIEALEDHDYAIVARFILELRKLVKSQGLDISKFI